MRKATRSSTIIRHVNHSEWGRGVILEESSGKVYLQFENGGRRAFLDAPRYRERLVTVDLPRDEAAAILSELEKYGPRLDKPRKRKAVRKTAGASSSAAPTDKT